MESSSPDSELDAFERTLLVARRLWWSKPELATITRKAERRRVARIDRIIANAAPETRRVRERGVRGLMERPPVVVIKRRDRSHDPKLSAGEEQRATVGPRAAQ